MTFSDLEIICRDKALAAGVAAKECCRRRELDPIRVHLMPETVTGFQVISRSEEELQRKYAE